MNIGGISLPNVIRATALVLLACLMRPPAKAATLSTVFQIPRGIDGALPQSSLVKLDGKYYGITQQGGTGGYSGGTVYTIDLKTSKETIVYNFTGGNDGGEPYDLFTFAGKLYGLTELGGSQQGGTVFEVDPATGAETTIYNLPANTYATSLVEYNGLFYGTGFYCGIANGAYKAGCVFSVDPVAQTGQTLFEFSFSGGAYFPGGLVRRGGVFYGGASGGHNYAGVLFKFDPSTNAENTVYRFSRTQGDVGAGLALDVNGTLYGTTTKGGQSGLGSVFTFNPDTHQITTIHSFGGDDGNYPGGLLSVGGLLYGVADAGGATGNGLVFSLDPVSGQYTIVHGFLPQEGYESSGLTEANGLLYGTMFLGGALNDGTVYSVDPATGQLSTLHSFSGRVFSNASGLIKLGSALYGTASGGGATSRGSIFKVDPVTNIGETLYSFNGTDGGGLSSALVGVGGTLYGTSPDGGSSGAGTVFSFDPRSRRLTTIYNFTGGSDGGTPLGSLTLANNALFGTTISGGTASKGTIFKIDLGSLQQTTLYSFSGQSGYSGYGVSSALVLANGRLYGTAENGGADHVGTIYSIDPATGAEATLYTFKGDADGVHPVAGLAFYNGLLYGSTSYSRQSPPTVFSFDPATGTKTVLHTFNSHPQIVAALVPAGSTLYGTVKTARNAEFGAVIRLNPTTGAVTSYDLPLSTTQYPGAPLLHTGNTFYGTTNEYDGLNAGTVFSFKP